MNVDLFKTFFFFAILSNLNIELSFRLILPVIPGEAGVIFSVEVVEAATAAETSSSLLFT